MRMFSKKVRELSSNFFYNYFTKCLILSLQIISNTCRINLSRFITSLTHQEIATENAFFQHQPLTILTEDEMAMKDTGVFYIFYLINSLNKQKNRV